MKLTPFELSVLVHCAAGTAQRFPNWSDPAYSETCHKWVERDVLSPDENDQHSYTLTDKGDAWMQAIMATPCPPYLRHTAANRRRQLLDAALELAAEDGGHYNSITRQQIAERAGCSTSLVQYTFGTIVKLRRAIVRAAVHTEHLPVIAQAITVGDQYVRKLPDSVRQAALDSTDS